MSAEISNNLKIFNLYSPPFFAKSFTFKEEIVFFSFAEAPSSLFSPMFNRKKGPWNR